GLLIDEARGGAGLDAFDAMLVMGECGRVLASVPLLGHLPASAILNDSANAAELLPALAQGEQRAAYLPAQPPSDVLVSSSTDPPRRFERGSMAGAGSVGADGRAPVTGNFAFVPDAPSASTLVGVALLGDRVAGVAIASDSPGVEVRPVMRYDATRSLGHVSLNDSPALILDAPEDSLAGAWHLAQALIAAESLGSVETALDVSVAYAKERHTFGRAIGSYQAIKHALTEVLRQLDNGRSLLLYAGW